MPKTKRRRGVRLEMTPLMDVMFLILVFFIYCIFDMAVHKGVKVELPSANGAQEKGERIIITIRQDDTMQLNDVDMPKAEVVDRVRELYALGMKLPVLISGDRNSSLGVGIELLGELRKNDIDKVSFQVKNK